MKSKPALTFLALTLIWGASFLWIKIAVEDLGPYGLVAIRLLLGLLGLSVFLIVQRPKVPRDVLTWRHLVILGLMNTALPWFLISWAEQSIDSALATVLNSTVPLFTIVIAHLALRDDRMTIARVLGIALGFSGVLVLIQRHSAVSPSDVTSAVQGAVDAAGGVARGLPHRPILGEVAMLIASLFYGASGVYARRNLRGVGATVQAFYSMLVASVVMWAMLPVLEPAFHLPTEPRVWVAVVWLGVLGAGVASFLLYYLLHAIGPSRTSFVTYTIPLVGVTLGVVVLHEALDWYLVAGTILIVSGVWVVNRR
jgi:drug/metabolite transporter (DMT)-like permease